MDLTTSILPSPKSVAYLYSISTLTLVTLTLTLAQAEAQKTAVDRVVIVRTGVVLAKEGGALAMMLPVFQLFAGGPLGSGRQWFSWVHRDDLVGLLERALVDDGMKGVFNGTAPRPVRMTDMCAELGRILVSEVMICFLRDDDVKTKIP